MKNQFSYNSMRIRFKKILRYPLVVNDCEAIVSNHADNLIHSLLERPHRFDTPYFIRLLTTSGLEKFVLNLLYFLLAIPSLVWAMEKPAPSLHQLARYYPTDTLAAFLNYAKNIDLIEKLPNGNTPLHEVSYPFYSDPENDDQRVIKSLMPNKEHEIARRHAFKADLLLKAGDPTILLATLNSKKESATMVAAKKGYLPVLARLMLSNPTDWPSVIYEIPATQVKTLIDSVTNMMWLRENYKHILLLRQDLHVELSDQQLLNLRSWASNNAHPEKNPLAQLDFKSLKYVFECYLTLDIYNQFLQNRNHPRAHAYFTAMESQKITFLNVTQ